MKCLNCEAEATYKVLNDSSEDQFYCNNDVPGFLRERGFEARLVDLLSERIENVDSPAAPKPPKKKKEEAVAEPVVEVVAEPESEPVVEVTVEESAE